MRAGRAAKRGGAAGLPASGASRAAQSCRRSLESLFHGGADLAAAAAAHGRRTRERASGECPMNGESDEERCAAGSTPPVCLPPHSFHSSSAVQPAHSATACHTPRALSSPAAPPLASPRTTLHSTRQALNAHHGAARRCAGLCRGRGGAGGGQSPNAGGGRRASAVSGRLAADWRFACPLPLLHQQRRRRAGGARAGPPQGGGRRGVAPGPAGRV